MNPDEFCTSDQWSVLTSAGSNSQLAGVLGGFLITAIALLFDKNSREGVHTLALFASAVLVLMLVGGGHHRFHLGHVHDRQEADEHAGEQ